MTEDIDFQLLPKWDVSQNDITVEACQREE